MVGFLGFKEENDVSKPILHVRGRTGNEDRAWFLLSRASLFWTPETSWSGWSWLIHRMHSSLALSRCKFKGKNSNSITLTCIFLHSPEPPRKHEVSYMTSSSFNLYGLKRSEMTFFRDQWTFVSSAQFPSFEMLIQTECWKQQKQG